MIDNIKLLWLEMMKDETNFGRIDVCGVWFICPWEILIVHVFRFKTRVPASQETNVQNIFSISSHAIG